MYSTPGGCCFTKIGINQSRETRAQLYDGYAINKKGTYEWLQFNSQTFIKTQIPLKMSII